MSLIPHDLDKRINAIKAVRPQEEHEAISVALKASSGDFDAARNHLTSLSGASLEKVTLAYQLGELMNENTIYIKALVEKEPNAKSLRDVALRFNFEALTNLVKNSDAPDDKKQKAEKYARAWQQKLYEAEPLSVLERMVSDDDVPVQDNVRDEVAKFLSNISNQPTIDIHASSVRQAIEHTDAFTGIAEEKRAGVAVQAKKILLARSLSPTLEAIPLLVKDNLTSAFQVTEVPEETFLKTYGPHIGDNNARSIYARAASIRLSNEQTLMTIRETIRGAGLAVLDGSESTEERLSRLRGFIPATDTVNLDVLFGDLDHCECGECSSVYSPAAYFVELLQYLRNNNLDPTKSNTGQQGIAGTLLQKLFHRRPDLAHLELTCENTNTVLPYVDLVNEVMESFVVNLEKYEADYHRPKQATIETFNVDDETSGELLAQPAHINYRAYCMVNNAVYPFTLPYHQPLDSIRSFLNHMGTSRFELVDTFRSTPDRSASTKPTRNKQTKQSQSQQDDLQALHQIVLDRAADAEFLGMTQEEYMILTREGFRPSDALHGSQQQPCTTDDVHQYYGYKTQNEMEDANEHGLTFVKRQFLPRTGIEYADLVGLLKAWFINPNLPQGEALELTENLRFSYRFLQTKVDTSNNSPKARFKKLLKFLQENQPNEGLNWEPLENWVYCYFERLGNLIVLDWGQGPQLPLTGEIFTEEETPQPIGFLERDGIIRNVENDIIGTVDFDGLVTDTNDKPFIEGIGVARLTIQVPNTAEVIGYIDGASHLLRISSAAGDTEPVQWLLVQETCDLEKVRLTHLDGSAVTVEEYDRMHRFIRLWRKMGWSVSETDMALVGLSTLADDADKLDYSTTNYHDCNDQSVDCPPPERVTDEVTPDFLHQLVGVRKLLDKTSLPLPKLLTFWTDIRPDSENSLYSSLFLTHNLLGIDKVFQLDQDGNRLMKSAKISQHLPILMAALNLKAEDIERIREIDDLSDDLTLSNVSALYRHSLLAKILHVKVADLSAVKEIFGDPFHDAGQAVEILEAWEKMEDAGFTFAQINYLIKDQDDQLRPVGPTESTILQITKTLYDGLNDIDDTHPDLFVTLNTQPPPKASRGSKGLLQIPQDEKDRATTEIVRDKAGLLLEQTVVDKIIGLLDGTTTYTAKAPANLQLVIPDELNGKLKYTKEAVTAQTSADTTQAGAVTSQTNDAVAPPGAIQVTGILTADEKAWAERLSDDPGWQRALERVGKQALSVFNEVLVDFFKGKEIEEAKRVLLTGDVKLPDASSSTLVANSNLTASVNGRTALKASKKTQAEPTGPIKRWFFLHHFLPILRQRLQHRLIVSTLSSSAGLPTTAIADLLLSEVLTVGDSNEPALTALTKINTRSPGNNEDWDGYIIPSVDDMFRFVVVQNEEDLPSEPPAIELAGALYSFSCQQEEPVRVWITEPTPRLKSGKLYRLNMAKETAGALQWKTATTSPVPIPPSALLPDYSSQATTESIVKLFKSAILVNGFRLSADEIDYLAKNANNFASIDFNDITFPHWKRLQAYTELRDQLPKTKATLLDLFTWAAKPDDPAKLAHKIAAVMFADDQDDKNVRNIQKLLSPAHFDLDNPSNFINEIELVKLRKALGVAEKINEDIDKLFDWAKPIDWSKPLDWEKSASAFWKYHCIAESIRQAVRARYSQENWEVAVKPLNDKLRENQKQALISYLIVQPVLREAGVIDADSLFEFFLIDVQMQPCMETSRIKQAIATVQQFVQRCHLGLEDRGDKNSGVPTDAPDRKRWDWMQRYRVWEANRKVFLYPENWIVSELRDDKSPFYRELESELLQKDINPQIVADALKAYLFKVDEVANMKVVGLFVDKSAKKIHIFSRTRNAPYFFYYMYYGTDTGYWYPWEKVQVDIPSYDHEETAVQVSNNGTYLTPVVWNNRLLIFFPQFAKKVAPNTEESSATTNEENTEIKVTPKTPTESWEIRMAWSEYRNGKWTQKQVSVDAVYDSGNGVPAPPIDAYQFVPRASQADGSGSRISIDIYHGTTAKGAFSFAGSQIFIGSTPSIAAIETTRFHYVDETETARSEIHSLQQDNENDPYFDEPLKTDALNVSIPSVDVHVLKDSINDRKEFQFYHPFSNELLGAVADGKLEELYSYYSELVPEIWKNAYGEGDASDRASYHELKRPYSIYNWELGFHAPMLLVDRLLKAQQFDEALKMCHYVFNPLAPGEVTDLSRFWQFPPFKASKATDAKNVLDKLFEGLKPNSQDADIAEWRKTPFNPHLIARARPAAYMKWVVAKYIEILIAYGDYYFRQNTLETVPLAIQCYVLASHIYGPKGQFIPKRGKIKPETYNSLLDRWDAFSNAMVELELTLPTSNQTTLTRRNNTGVEGFGNIFGFATTLYFCIPDNPQLRALRETIDDRLFKIRHCQDINGVFRRLPLFEPPIDPALLVQAAAQGLSLSAVLSDLNGAMPNYRFSYLLQKAMELCTELKAMGNTFLSIKEKGDAEALARLRASHESNINNLVMEVRKQQLEEAQKALEALQQSRQAPVYRLRHYLRLIGEDLGKVPDSSSDFGELPDAVEQPINLSGLKLTSYEKEEIDKASEAADWQVGIGVVETLASVFHALPTVTAAVHPWGVGADINWGPPHLGNATQAVARGLRIHADQLSFKSTSAGRKGGFLRQLQDRVQQANTAGYEIKNIDRQILAQQIRINIATQEITNHQKQIDNAQEMDEFLRNKYSNQELYSWIEGSIRTLYYQFYTLAYDLAKKAEKTYQFERGETSNFIQFGYWEAARDGLLAGERMYLGLMQLEAAHQEKRGYDYEVTKHVSLRQVNPLALLRLRETGITEFSLPEVLFDMDHPGHYKRRIKSVALTVPAVVGPYTGLNCTLRLLNHKVRVDANDISPYPEKTGETDSRFWTVNIPTSSIAVSSGQNDSGVFELNFRDERYLPFEGAGVVSSWRLELPVEFRQFDYDTISDVVMHIRYTAVDGGDKLKAPAATSIREFIKTTEQLSNEQGLFAAFDLIHDFPSEWNKAMHPVEGATSRVLTLKNLRERLPVYTKGRSENGIQVTDFHMLTTADLPPSTTLSIEGIGNFSLAETLAEGGMRRYIIDGITEPLTPQSSMNLAIADLTTKIEGEEWWLVIRYILT